MSFSIISVFTSEPLNFQHSLALGRDSISTTYFAGTEQLRNFKILKGTQNERSSEGTKMQVGIRLAIRNVHYNSS
jgi:hypothetical protein